MLMLATIQRPGMGSSKDNQNGSPFGCKCTIFLVIIRRSYSCHVDEFGPSNHVYPQNPPQPPPGQPILAQADKGALMNFFDDVGSGDFGQHMYSDSFPDGLTDSSFWNNSLSHDFMAMAPAFPQQPLPYMTTGLQNLNYDPAHLTSHLNGSLTEAPSADVLLGAAALLQNNHRHMSQSNMTEPIFSNSSHLQPRLAQSTHTTAPFASTSIRHDPLFMQHTQPVYTAKHPAKSMNMNWGSDQNFVGSQGFVAPDGQEDRVAIEQRQLGLLGCFQPRNPSATSTNFSSPNSSKSLETQGQEISQKPIRLKKEPRKSLDTVDTREPPPNGTVTHDSNETVERSLQTAYLKKRRSKNMDSYNEKRSQSPPLSSKRRKSTASSGTKLARENLTEGQKRENHIKSEQKRRTLIKEGFDDLNELVPDLRSGGFSKSVILTMAADFLDDLVQENNRLRSAIAKLESRSTG